MGKLSVLVEPLNARGENRARKALVGGVVPLRESIHDDLSLSRKYDGWRLLAYQVFDPPWLDGRSLCSH